MNGKVSRKNFIRLGAALSVTATGASMMAACGGGSSGNSGGSGSDASNSSSKSSATSSSAGSSYGGSASGGSNTTKSKGQAQQGKAIASVSKVAPGSALNFKDSGQPAVLIHLNSGDFVAYSRICTHQGCTVAYQNGQLACPCHGSVYDPAHGARVVAGPAPQPLPAINVKVKGGQVFRA